MASEALAALLAGLHDGAAPDLSLPGRRATFERLCARLQPLPDSLPFVPVDAGGVPAEWVPRAPQGAENALLFLHGGGYTVGSPRTHRDLVGRVAHASGRVALSLDYRLAPEHPFPAALDDAVAGYRWLLAAVGNSRRIVVAGDSAGGGLALGLLVALRDRGMELPAAGMVISPWTDLALTGASLAFNAAKDPLVQRASAAGSVARYIGPEGDARCPRASPLYADLRGLPPLLIQVGLDESLLDDSLRFAARATRAGVTVTLDVWEGMTHIWPFFSAILPEGEAAVAAMGRYAQGHAQ